MGGFGECLETRVRQLWHYNTTFGSLGFNILAIQFNVFQLILTAVLLGVYHSYITIEYIWWPVFECLRIFLLTMCRADVLLKDISDIRSNSRASSQTRRIIMLCNLIGAASIIIASPVYLFLLPKINTSMYWTFLITFSAIILMRIVLTIPMFSALIYGTSMYRIIDGNNYERIADPTDRQQHATDPLLASGDAHNESSSDRPQYDIPDDVLAVLREENQMDRALRASRRESMQEQARREREQQDREYQEALNAERRLEDAKARSNSSMGSDFNMYDENDNYDELVTSDDININENNTNKADNNNFNNNTNDAIINIDNDNDDDNEQGAIEDELLTAEQEKEEAIQEILSALPELTEEPLKSNETVSVRIRLPKGKQCIRRFDNSAKISDICNWVNHELVNNENAELINEFLLVSTMPRTVYDDKNKTLKDLKFWRENSKMECRTPLLYVEEQSITPGADSDDDDDDDDE